MFRNITRSNAAFFTILMLAAAPLAASAAETRTVLVHSGDLNLANDAGRAMFQQRITHAVATVCGSDFARTTEQAKANATCRKQVLASTEPQINLMVAKAQASKKVAMGGGKPASE